MKIAVKKLAAPLLCGLFTFLLFKFVFFIGYVPSESMEPTIKEGSVITGCRVIVGISRGDVLVFSHHGKMLVKRVAAVPGDVVYIDDVGQTLSVNEELPDASRVLTVPNSCYFMLGDNAGYSIDSRMWEEPFVKREQVIAKLWGG